MMSASLIKLGVKVLLNAAAQMAHARTTNQMFDQMGVSNHPSVKIARARFQEELDRAHQDTKAAIEAELAKRNADTTTDG